MSFNLVVLNFESKLACGISSSGLIPINHINARLTDNSSIIFSSDKLYNFCNIKIRREKNGIYIQQGI